jgi:hypothetical protein
MQEVVPGFKLPPVKIALRIFPPDSHCENCPTRSKAGSYEWGADTGTIRAWIS